ncbi:MAG: hypothetical protein HOV80_32425, partial [Polyangiaceae bacterium]|nr:hypothetical protein [Polyangiaceae bacterium]
PPSLPDLLPPAPEPEPIRAVSQPEVLRAPSQPEVLRAPSQPEEPEPIETHAMAETSRAFGLVNDSVPPPAAGAQRFAFKRAWIAPVAAAAAIVLVWLTVRGMTEPSSSSAAEPAPSTASPPPTAVVPPKPPEPTASPAPPAADPVPTAAPEEAGEPAASPEKKKKKTPTQKLPRKKRYSPTRI